MILVVRCQDGPAAVPSDKVECSVCGAECWLSKYSGEQTMQLAASLGQDEFVCSKCFFESLGTIQTGYE